MPLIQHIKQKPIARKTGGGGGMGGGFGSGHIGGGLGGGHIGGGFGDGFHDGHHRFGEAFRGGAYGYFPYDDYGYADDGGAGGGVRSATERKNHG